MLGTQGSGCLSTCGVICLYFHSWCSYTGAREVEHQVDRVGLSQRKWAGKEEAVVGKGMPEAEILELIQVLVVTLRMTRLKVVQVGQREREQIRKLGNILERHS